MSLRVLSNGNVGIGNKTPDYLLSIGNNIVGGSDGKISIGKNNGAGGSRFFTIKYNANFDMCLSDSDNKDVFKVSYNAPADSLIVNVNGNVGIGDNNPSQKWTVSGNILATGNVFASPAYKGGFYSGDTNWGFEINESGGQYWTECVGHGTDETRGFGLFNNAKNTIPFRVDGNGNVNILGAVSMLSLHVGFTGIGVNMWHNSSDGRQIANDARHCYKGTHIVPFTWRRGNDTDITTRGQTGNFTIVGALNQASDTRIKKEIVDIDDNEGLYKILILEPKTYKYIDETKGTDKIIVFTAQQIQEIFPEAITIGDNRWQ